MQLSVGRQGWPDTALHIIVSMMHPVTAWRGWVDVSNLAFNSPGGPLGGRGWGASHGRPRQARGRGAMARGPSANALRGAAVTSARGACRGRLAQAGVWSAGPAGVRGFWVPGPRRPPSDTRFFWPFGGASGLRRVWRPRPFGLPVCRRPRGPLAVNGFARFARSPCNDMKRYVRASVAGTVPAVYFISVCRRGGGCDCLRAHAVGQAGSGFGPETITAAGAGFGSGSPVWPIRPPRSRHATSRPVDPVALSP